MSRAEEHTHFIFAVLADEIALVLISVLALALLVGLWRWWRRREEP